jgi:multidrug efflux pump subunit AcrA (membrane-fusion protein)
MKKIIGLSSRIKKPLAVGMFVLVVSFGGFWGWALFAPLDSSAVAKGTVIVDTYPKEVQHLEGGIIEEIYIHEGDSVEEGDPLIALERTKAGAEVGLLSDRYYALVALESRLVAEKNHEKEIVFPEDILAAAKNDVVVAESIEAQKTEFEARQLEIEGVKSILQKRIA